jgi:hypothetical protein
MKVLPESIITSIEAYASTVPLELIDVLGNSITDVNTDNINLVSLDETLVLDEYPAENVLDEHPKRICKVNWHSAMFTFDLPESSNVIVMGYTNAATARVMLFDENDTVVLDEVVSFSDIDSYQDLITDNAGRLLSVAVPYEYIYTPHRAQIIFDNSNKNEDLYVGLIQAGVLVVSTYDTNMGLSESLEDYGTTKQLSNGAFFYDKKDIVRTFSGRIRMERDMEFFMFMRNIFQRYGQKPMYWAVTDLKNNNWVVYARVARMPSGSHDFPKESFLNFNLIEVL